MNIHASITPRRVSLAMEQEMFGLANPGFCLHCGEEQEGCEPDAEGYTCDVCERDEVQGAMNVALLIM